MLLCIDGTGDSSDRQYAIDMANSFVNRIHRRGCEPKHYMRGPTVTGIEMESIVNRGRNFVVDNYVENTGVLQVEIDPVLLAGYSRGAAAVVMVAQRLHLRQIPVRAIVLFDCVDRAAGAMLDSTQVSPNVQTLIHARRDDRAQSRPYFGHSASRVPPTTRHIHQDFYGTHGALGGARDRGLPPGTLVSESGVDTCVTAEQDEACEIEVWRWVEPELRRLGFIDRPSMFGTGQLDFSPP